MRIMKIAAAWLAAAVIGAGAAACGSGSSHPAASHPAARHASPVAASSSPAPQDPAHRIIAWYKAGGRKVLDALTADASAQDMPDLMIAAQDGLTDPPPDAQAARHWNAAMGDYIAGSMAYSNGDTVTATQDIEAGNRAMQDMLARLKVITGQR